MVSDVVADWFRNIFPPEILETGDCLSEEGFRSLECLFSLVHVLVCYVLELCCFKFL